jgi:diadenosine tetraphosphate (Ap4A) HIT family hydrolase/8-oxo-dGTP pyrophosphatase MutT (NUDIX family)
MDSSHSHRSKTLVTNCPLCQVVTAGAQHHEFICELQNVVVTRGPFAQRWPGAVQVTCKRHLRDPGQLKYPHFIHSQAEIYALENAIRTATRAHHMNVVKFGNVVEHLHWHLIPRFEGETHPQKNPWELADLPAEALFHTSSKQPLDLLYAEITDSMKSLLKQAQPPYFATAFFVRPRAKAEQASFLRKSLEEQRQAIGAAPAEFECFLMQRNYLDFAWDTFGGEIDAGETPQMALHRELQEELGWGVVRELEVTRQWGNGMVRGFVYLVEPKGGVLLQDLPTRTPCDEVKEAAWIPLQDLLANTNEQYAHPLCGRARALVAGLRDFSL